MSEEKIKNLFQITTDRMYTALESYYVWKKMSQMVNIHDSGEDQAKRNVEIFKKYWDCFHPIQHSTYKSFITDLAIFFDANKYEDSFSMNKLLEEMRNKISSDQYTEMVQEINNIKKQHGVKIGFILELRNTGISHQEIERKQRLIKYKDIEELFKATQEILNILSDYHNDSHTMWDHVEQGVTGTFDWIINNLERGEKVRIEEIRNKRII